MASATRSPCAGLWTRARHACAGSPRAPHTCALRRCAAGRRGSRSCRSSSACATRAPRGYSAATRRASRPPGRRRTWSSSCAASCEASSRRRSMWRACRARGAAWRRRGRGGLSEQYK
eukprot:414685-Prymnesium_polylepis.1